MPAPYITSFATTPTGTSTSRTATPSAPYTEDSGNLTLTPPDTGTNGAVIRFDSATLPAGVTGFAAITLSSGVTTTVPLDDFPLTTDVLAASHFFTPTVRFVFEFDGTQNGAIEYGCLIYIDWYRSQIGYLNPSGATLSTAAQSAAFTAITEHPEARWTVDCAADWITLTGTIAGTGSGTTIDFDVTENNTGSSRSALIYLRVKDAFEGVSSSFATVTQNLPEKKTIAFAGVVGAPIPSISPRQRGYSHEQTTPSTTWEITHNLGHYPSVAAVDGPTGSSLEGDVTHPSLNRTVITFGSARTGSASLT